MSDRPEFVTDLYSFHHNTEVIVLDIDGDMYVVPKYEASEFFRGLATSLGCLDGFDPDVYTEINGMVREERES